MAIIEIVLLKLHKDPKLVEEAGQKVTPTLIPKLRDGGVLGGMRGVITVQDGQDITADHREALILEWPAASDFYTFVASPGFAEYKADFMPYAGGPPELKLFETNAGVQDLLKHAVVEILVLRPKDTSEPEAISSLLKKVEAGLREANATSDAVHGSSLNLEKTEVIIMNTYRNKAEFEVQSKSQARRNFSDTMREASDLTQLVVEVDKLPL